MIQETLVAKEYSEIVFRSRKKPAVSKILKYPIFRTKKKEKYDSYQIRTNNFCHTCIFIKTNLFKIFVVVVVVLLLLLSMNHYERYMILVNNLGVVIL
jgi:hypothetical protein